MVGQCVTVRKVMLGIGARRMLSLVSPGGTSS